MNELKTYKCLKPDCGWEWASRLPLPPRYCARCKRQNWDKAPGPPKPQSMKPEPRPKRKYPVDQLQVGQSVDLPWFWIDYGNVLDARKNAAMRRAIHQEEVRYGKKFRFQAKAFYLHVERTK